MPACMQRHCLIGDNGALGGGVGGARGGARGGEGGGARGDQAKENSIAPPASGSLGQPARAGATAGRTRLPADKAEEVSRVLTSVTALRGSLPPAPPRPLPRVRGGFFFAGVWGRAPGAKKTRKFGIKILARRARILIPNFRRHILRLIAAYGIDTRT